MSKISDAQDILSVLGLPPAQQNEISALTLLALCGLKEEDNWADATRKLKNKQGYYGICQ